MFIFVMTILNQGNGKIYARRRSKVSVAELEIENQDHTNVQRNNHPCTFETLLPDAQKSKVQHVEVQSSDIHENPTHENNQLKIKYEDSENTTRWK